MDFTCKYCGSNININRVKIIGDELETVCDNCLHMASKEASLNDDHTESKESLKTLHLMIKGVKEMYNQAMYNSENEKIEDVMFELKGYLDDFENTCDNTLKHFREYYK